MASFDEDQKEDRVNSRVYLMIAFSILFLISLLVGFFVIVLGNRLLGILLMVGSLLALCCIGVIFTVYRDVITNKLKKEPTKEDDDIDELIRLYRK